MKLFKLTDQEGYTRRGNSNQVKWADGHAVVCTSKRNPHLCTNDVVHGYKNSNLALLLNPQHADIRNPLLWEAEGEIVAEDWGKIGCFSLTTIGKLPIPEWYADEKKRKMVCVAFAILCAEAVLQYFEKDYPADDRPRKAIEAAREYLQNPTVRAAADAAADAARAADAAADAAAAAYAAARAADAAADAAAAAYAAARAADAAYPAYPAADAASAAADAASAAADAAEKLDFCKLADEAVEMVKDLTP
jgi:hypothetical protein